MTTIKLDPAQAKLLVWEELEDFEVYDESDDWTQEGKYQACEVIYKQISTGKFFSAILERSGSYHTNWFYLYEDFGLELTEVELREKVITVREWVAV